jgi:hypothetical protein
MGKGGALVFAVLVAAVAVGTVALLTARRVSYWVWVVAEAQAQWEPDTDEAADCEADGTPIAVVTVQLVARSFGRRRVLKVRPVGKCPVQYPGDPALLDLQARAANQADTRNTSLRGEY